MDDAHLEAVEVTVLAVRSEGAKDAFVTHPYELDDAVLQLNVKSRVGRHHLNQLDDILFFTLLVLIKKSRVSAQVIEAW